MKKVSKLNRVTFRAIVTPITTMIDYVIDFDFDTYYTCDQIAITFTLSYIMQKLRI